MSKKCSPSFQKNRIRVFTAVLSAALVSAGVLLFSAWAKVAETTPSPDWQVPAAPLRIGFMEPETTGPLTVDWFRGLKAFLESDPNCSILRERMGPRYDGFALIAAEGYNDLVRRMGAMEFEIVFCPAVAFAQQLPDPNTTGPVADRYTAVFQLEAPTDIGRMPQRSGVIIVNRNHPLYRPPHERGRRPVDPIELARRFAGEPVALVSVYSATGYIDPLNHMFDVLGPAARPRQPIFCGSSEEVVKKVLSDVVSIGACEKGSVERVMRNYGVRTPPSQAVDELVTLPGSPTDPIAFRWELRPRPDFELGPLLKRALADYFYFSAARLGGLRLRESEDGYFKYLRHALIKFNRFAPRGGR